MSFQRLKSADRDGGETGASSGDKQMKRQMAYTKETRDCTRFYAVAAALTLIGVIIIAVLVGVTYTNSKTLVDRPPPVYVNSAPTIVCFDVDATLIED
jgi:hypothetical protein